MAKLARKPLNRAAAYRRKALAELKLLARKLVHQMRDRHLGSDAASHLRHDLVEARGVTGKGKVLSLYKKEIPAARGKHLQTRRDKVERRLARQAKRDRQEEMLSA